MTHRIQTGPNKLPVDVNMAKLHLRLEDDDEGDDALVVDALESAREQCEKFTGRALITQTWELFMDRWPLSSTQGEWWDGVREGPVTWLGAFSEEIPLPRPPLQSVTFINTYDDSDVATLFAASNYFVDTNSEPGKITLRRGIAAPTVDRVRNGLEVRYITGYGDEISDIPSSLRQGILKMVAHLYEHRGDDPEEAAQKSGAKALWDHYKIRTL